MDVLRTIGTDITGQDSAWFWTMLQTIAVTITLFLIYRQLSVARYANMLDTLARLDQKWDRESMLRARHDICLDYISKEELDDKRITYREAQILDFFEDIGIFLKRRVLDRETVWESYSYSIEHYWQMMQLRVKEFRTSSNDKTWYDNFEHLAEAMRKVSQKKDATNPDKTAQEMEKFAIGEIQRLESAAIDSDITLAKRDLKVTSKDEKD